MKRAFLLFGALALAGCLDTSAPAPGSDPATETFATSLGVNIASMQKTPSGTYYQDIVVGTGNALTVPPATAATQVTVDYTGWLKTGEQFDTGTGKPFQLGGVIYGFADGMIGMNVGGDRLIVVPSDLAYGNSSNGSIPGRSTLVFRVKLKAFQ